MSRHQNELRIRYAYDACDEVTSIGYYNPGGNGQNFLSYSYDPAGNVTVCNQGWYTTTYGYDGADQLVSETGGGTYAPPTLVYTYDHNGNRLTQTQNGTQVQSFTYNAHDVLVSGTAGNETPGYDANGNETSNSIYGGTYHETYDDEDRLTSITGPGYTDTFTYNGLGLRVGKTDSTGTYSYVCDGTTPGSPVLSDGHALYTPGLSENRGGTSTYAAYDLLGNLWFMDNGSAQQTFYQDTTAFGSGQNMGIGGTEAGPFKFGGGNGCQTDADTGLVLMGHRYYDTRIGRFITQDPAGAGGNWYRYAGNNPTNHVDPTGLYIENPEPVTDQTRGNLLFAQAFYGDRSGFSNFLDQEAQTELRGETQYAASEEVAHAYIDPNFNTEQQMAIQSSLALIAGTSRGAEIMAAALWGKNYIGVYDTEFSSNSAVFDQPGITFTVGVGNIGVNPAVLPYYQVENTDGWDTPSILQVVAHELGHGLTGVKDSGPGNNNNVYANENPILSELGQPTRLSYGGVRSLPNPYGL